MLTSLVILSFLAADPDPEPSGGSLRRLEGVWRHRAVLERGKERAADVTYTFAKGRVTYSVGGDGGTREAALVPDKRRKDIIELKGERGRPARYLFKFEKDKLYLRPIPPGDADPKPDFSGNTAPVLILTREKK